MTNFILIGVCIIAGMLFKYTKALPADAHKGINAWIIYLALPAVSFKYLPYIHWTSELLFPAMAPVIVWLVAWLFTTLFTRTIETDKGTQGALKLTSGLSNTSFLGFPLIMAYFGEKYIAIGVICDQVTFVLLSTAGVIVAISSSQNRELSASVIIKKVLRFPPFLGCIAALTLPHLINIAPAAPFFDKLAATVGPLALFSVGLQLKFEGWRSEIRLLSASLFYKLFLAPAIVLAIALLLQLKGMIPRISVFEMAMPSLLTSGVVADEYNVNPKLSNLIIGVGIVISFASTAFWWWILNLY